QDNLPKNQAGENTEDEPRAVSSHVDPLAEVKRGETFATFTNWNSSPFDTDSWASRDSFSNGKPIEPHVEHRGSASEMRVGASNQEYSPGCENLTAFPGTWKKSSPDRWSPRSVSCPAKFRGTFPGFRKRRSTLAARENRW